MALCSILNAILKVKDIIIKMVQGDQSILINIILLTFAVLSTVGIISCAIAVFIFSYPVFKSFGWRMFKYIGGDQKLRRYFKIYTAFKSILKLDTCVSFIVWYLNFMLVPTGDGGRDFIQLIFIYTGLAIGFFIIILTFFYFSFTSRREIYILHIIGIILNLWPPLLNIMIYIVALIYLKDDEIDGFGNPWYFKCNIKSECRFGVDEVYTYIVVGLLTVVSTLLKFITLFMALLVMFNFRKGLKKLISTVSKMKSKNNTNLNEIEKMFAKGRDDMARQFKDGKSEGFELNDADFIDEEDDDNSLFDDEL